VAELVYRLDGERLVLTHTRVPEELGGRGLGGVLVRAAVDRAEAEGLTVVPECTFAKGWLEKHPDDAARISIDWPATEG
jgi:predicted GNAT family acetyltransferase